MIFYGAFVFHGALLVVKQCCKGKDRIEIPKAEEVSALQVELHKEEKR